ncbi:Transcription activator, effector binding [Legionella busanensis]|uniref:Transcription activator, effector binding n=1 Tax=Legionella busanensis TaxID=190655 RepID=A0A378JQK9_9GAMM|nr:GyrI-like domain-containing protein [Legionella busanensis]STX50412.1 Transcription activator, effector binding [Legionella busanensis]
MTMIKPNMQFVDSFKVVGFSIRTKNSDEFIPKTAKIPNLWQQFNASQLKDITPVFGVYSDYESDVDGSYNITVGVTNKDGFKLNHVTITAGKYLVFKNSGPIPDIIVNTWKLIWDYFANETTYQRNYMTDFEHYNGSEVAIYIGINE